MSKNVLYVVFVGRTVGIHQSWDECHKAVNGFPGSKFKGYKVAEDAFDAWEKFEETGIADTHHGKHYGHPTFRADRLPATPNSEARRKREELDLLDSYARALVKDHSGPNGAGSHSHDIP